MKRHVLICDCGDYEHQVVFSFPDDDREMFCAPHLTTWKNPLRRLWVAIRYVFGYRSQFGAWDELVMTEQGVRELRAFLDKFLGENPEPCYWHYDDD